MARRLPPSFEGRLPQREGDWLAFAVSGLSHLVLILLAFAIVRASQREVEQTQRTVRRPPDTTIVFLPPPPTPTAPTPQVQPAPATPVEAVPITRRLPPEKDPNAASDAIKHEGTTQESASAPEAPEATGDPDGVKDVTTPIEEPVALGVTMESEAQRLFGRRRGPPANETGPVAVRPFENAMPSDDNCPKIPRDSTTGDVPEGTVQGRVVDYENGQPLRGAHLQMVGQPFNTFADDFGNFLLRFDLRLMENCRVQVVRITSAGHKDQTLPIVLGGGVSTVPLRRR